MSFDRKATEDEECQRTIIQSSFPRSSSRPNSSSSSSSRQCLSSHKTKILDDNNNDNDDDDVKHCQSSTMSSNHQTNANEENLSLRTRLKV